MNKTLQIIGIIVLVVVLGAGGWFLVAKQSQKKIEVKNENQREEQQVVKDDSQKQSEEKVEELPAQGWSAQGEKTEDIDTSNWKTYSSTICGIEFKYPSKYYIQVFDEQKDVCNVLISKFQKFRPDYNVSLQYTTIFTDKEDFLNCSLKNIMMTNSEKRQIEWLIPCDNKFKKQNYEQLLNGNCNENNIILANKKTLLQRGDNHVISIRCNTKDAVDAKTILTILQSFKFFPKNS